MNEKLQQERHHQRKKQAIKSCKMVNDAINFYTDKTYG